MNPYLELVRLNICLLSVFGLIVGFLLVKLPLNFWILPILAVFLISASGNIINDFFDFEIDKINKPERPLPSGRVSKKRASLFYFVLSLAGLTISFFVSLNFFILALFNSILIFLYSKKFKKTVFGNPIDSWLACSVFLAPVLILGDFSELLTSKATILSIIAFFGNYGREILKDVEDIKGDRIEKARTLPIVIGKNRATILGKIMIFIGAIFLLISCPLFSKLYLFLSLICFIFCIYILTIRDVRKAQRITKLVMFLVIFSFLISLLF